MIRWAVATMLGWLLAHPIVHLFALETSPLWGTAIVALVAAASLAHALARRRAGLAPRWRAIMIDAGWAVVAVVALAFTRPGSLASVFQWPLLRPIIPGAPAWMLVSTIGAGLTWAVGGVVVLDRFSQFTLHGTLLGLVQWVLLRRYLTSAGWWILASAIGWLAGGLATTGVVILYGRISDHLSAEAALAFAHVVPPLIGGLLCGLVTGAALTWLARTGKTG